MPKEKPANEVEEGWEGFPARLRFAVTTRIEQWGTTVRQIAIAANYDESNLGKMLAKKPDRWQGLQANSLLAFARALDVHPMWLLTGVEPSGLKKKAAETPAPPSNIRDSQGAIRLAK